MKTKCLKTAIFFFAAITLLGSPAGAVEVQRVVSPGGIEAWLIEDRTNPMITMDIGFRAGSRLDPNGKEGLARFVSSTIDEGAGNLDSQAFQGQLEDLAISLSFDSDLDFFSGSLRTLTRNKETAFELMRLALTEPRFDDDAVERLRSQLISSSEQSLQNPRTIARRALSEALFAEHPYSRNSDGDPDTLATISTEDLRDYTQKYLAKDNLIIGVVGDISGAELAPILDKTFGGLPDKAQDTKVADATVPANGRTVVLDKEIPQSIVYFAQDGLKRSDPDFYAATVLNYILGGGSFVSRLYQEVREKRGLVYSVSTSLLPRDYVGLVVGAAATENARVAETISIIRDEWDRIGEDGVTAEELEGAKTYLTGSFPLRFSSSGRISGMLVGMQRSNLGIDYLDRRGDYIDAVTLEQVNNLAGRLLSSEKLTMVVVGQPEGLNLTQ